MPAPIEGLQILRVEYGSRGQNDEFKEFGYGAVRFRGKLYIYLNGSLLGPVQKVIRKVYVDGHQGKVPQVVMFGHGKKVGLFVDGVKGQLFDEVNNFKCNDGHFWYIARKGDKWCYVIDGNVHGWFDQVANQTVWFKNDSQDQIFWAKKDGHVAYWLNNRPLELFDESNFEISFLDWTDGHISFKIKRINGGKIQEGIWRDGFVERWFDKISGYLAPFRQTADGLVYIGTNAEEGEYLFLNGQFIGPYDKIQRYSPERFGLPAGTLLAVFEKDGKQYARVASWSCGRHREIKSLKYSCGHRVMIGFDQVGSVELFTYYVDEQMLYSGMANDGYIEDGKLCFKKQTVDSYPIQPSAL